MIERDRLRETLSEKSVERPVTRERERLCVYMSEAFLLHHGHVIGHMSGAPGPEYLLLAALRA